MPKTARIFTTTRTAGLFLAALLQAGFIWALVEGLNIKVGNFLPPPIDVFIPKPVPKAPPEPVRVRDILPDPVSVPKPTIDTGEAPGDTALTFPPPHTSPPGAVERGPVGLMATHTTPPYPPLEARLGNEGTVLLRLIIGPDGLVKAASVLHSSGHAALDQAAQIWVRTHWRYQPAQRGGAAVESAANVAVSFNLRNGAN